jgi:quercetin dioxygenase-like cupin family protein
MSRVRPALGLAAGAIGVASSLTLAWAQAPIPQPGKPLTGPNGEQLVHVFDEPRHRTVFQEGSIRVLDIQIPPGDTTLFHTHTTAILYVTIGRSQTRSQTFGKDWPAPAAPRPAAAAAAVAGTGPGPASRTSERLMSSPAEYVTAPLTHRVNNVGTSTFRLIGVSNASPGAAGAADETPGIAGEREIANDYFRGYRSTLAPGASLARHSHKTPVIVVQATDGQVTADGGKGALSGPGSLIYVAAGQPHAVTNAGSGAVTVVEVEVRQPAR